MQIYLLHDVFWLVDRAYKYLGAIHADSGALGPEVSYRLGSAKQAYRQISGKVFGAKEAPSKTRVSLAGSLLWSRMLLYSNSWGFIGDRLIARTANFYNMFHRTIAAQIRCKGHIFLRAFLRARSEWLLRSRLTVIFLHNSGIPGGFSQHP